MTTLRTLKKLILGETLVLPAGVVATLVVAVALRHVAGDAWHRWGGFVLLAGAVTVLLVSVARGARPG
jgi:hypothetical protein